MCNLIEFISRYSRDAKIVYDSMKQLEIPLNQLFIHDDELWPVRFRQNVFGLLQE